MVVRAAEIRSMPQGGPELSDENKDLLVSWAEQGALENCD
jgi:hypothetical protein